MTTFLSLWAIPVGISRVAASRHTYLSRCIEITIKNAKHTRFYVDVRRISLRQQHRHIDAFYCQDASEAMKTKGGAVITLGNNATYYSTIPQGDKTVQEWPEFNIILWKFP